MTRTRQFLSQDPTELICLNPESSSEEAPDESLLGDHSKNSYNEANNSITVALGGSISSIGIYDEPSQIDTTYAPGIVSCPSFSATRPKDKIVATIFGYVRAYHDIKWLEKVYVIFSLVSIFLSMGVTINHIIFLSKIQSNSTEEMSDEGGLADPKTDFTFCILLIWTTAWSLYHVLTGVASQRAYDIAVYILSTAVIWIYVLINYMQADDSNRTVAKPVRLAVSSCVDTLILGIGVYLGFKYYRSKKFIINVIDSTNYCTVKMYSLFLVHDSVLKFDIQMAGSALILWLQTSWLEPDLRRVVPEIIVIIIGCLLTALWAKIGYRAVYAENIRLVHAFYVLSLLEPTVVIYNIVRTAMITEASTSLKVSAYVCGAIALISRGVSILLTYLVSQNFGKGLKLILQEKYYELNDSFRFLSHEAEE